MTDLIAPVEHTDAQLANSAGNLFLGGGGGEICYFGSRLTVHCVLYT